MYRVLSLLLLLAVLTALCLPPTASAQEVGARYRVVLTGGTVMVGTLVSATETEVVLEDERGLRTTIPRVQITTLEAFSSGFYRADPNATRLLLFPTARSLPAGTGRFGTYIVFPTVAYGVTDNFDVSLGSTIPIDGVTIMNLNGKLTAYQTARMSFAVGGSAVLPLGADAGGIGGTFYGVATFGPSEQAFTIGGIGVYATDFDDDTEIGDGGALVLGFEKQVSNHVKFLTENYVGISDGVQGALLSAGVRFFGERLSADIAPVLAIGDGDATFSPVPYFTFSYAFGR